MKNKFLKYPLVLGIVGIICALCLGVVYWITNPIITERTKQKALAAIQSICAEAKNSVEVTENYANCGNYTISAIYDVSGENEQIGVAYQATGVGYGGSIVYLVVLSSSEDKIIGINFISHSETSGYGADLIAKEEFVEWFKDLAFEEVANGTDISTGATKTMTGIKNSLLKVIDFHTTVKEAE